MKSIYDDKFSMKKSLQEYWYQKLSEEYSDNDLEFFQSIIKRISSERKNPSEHIVDWRYSSRGASFTVPKGLLSALEIEDNQDFYVGTNALHNKCYLLAEKYENEKDQIGSLLLETPINGDKKLVMFDDMKLALFKFHIETFNKVKLTFNKRIKAIIVEPFYIEEEDDQESDDEVFTLFEDQDTHDEENE